MPPPISGNRPSPSLSTGAPVAAPPPKPVAAPPPAPKDSFTPSTRIKTNSGNTGVDTARGQISAAAWKSPEKVLGNLTQNPNDKIIGNMNCGPSSMLGGAIMQGQGPTAGLLNRVADDPAYSKLTPEDRAQLKTIANGVTNGTGSFADLNAAQALLYKAGNTDGAEGFTSRELVDLAPKGQVDTLLLQKDASGDPDLNGLLKQLRPGDSAMVVIKGDTGNDDSPHYITVGKKADGTPFVYNPDPDVASDVVKGRDRTLVTGQAGVQNELNGYKARVVTDRPELGDVVVVHAR